MAYSTVYSDVDAIAGLAKRFDLAQGRSAAIGARFRYESLTTTPDYAPVKFYLLDLGFTFGISSEFSVAATALNLFGSGTRDGAGTVEERPVDLLFGAGYRPSDTPIAISATLESEESFGTTVHLGISYALVDALSLSAATTTDSGTISVGAHFKYDPALIDLGVRFDHAFGSVVTFGLTGQW